MTSKKRRLLLAKVDEIQGLIAQAKSLHMADVAERDKVIQARDLEVLTLKRLLAIIADMAAGTNVRAFGGATKGGGAAGMSFAEFRKTDVNCPSYVASTGQQCTKPRNHYGVHEYRDGMVPGEDVFPA